MNTAVQNQAPVETPATAAAVMQQVANPAPSFAAELGGDAAEGANEITDEMLDSMIGGDIEEGPEVKTTNNFEVRVRKAADSKKKIKGSIKAMETLITVAFTRLPPGAVVAEDAPKKRGRKPKAQAGALVSEGSRQNFIRMKFYDSVDNAAVDFIETLHSKEDFSIDVGVLGEEGEVETFTCDGCNVVPQTIFEEFSRNDGMGKPREVSVFITFKEQTRTSVGAEPEAE